jgi:hypothetical protein
MLQTQFLGRKLGMTTRSRYKLDKLLNICSLDYFGFSHHLQNLSTGHDGAAFGLKPGSSAVLQLQSLLITWHFTLVGVAISFVLAVHLGHSPNRK